MKHSLWKLYGAYFFSESGRGIYFVSVTWLLYLITEDPLYTGLLVSLGFIPGMALNLFLGVWVDRSDRKKLAVLANGVSFFILMVLTGAFAFDQIQPWIILLTHMFIQLAGSLMRPAIQAFVAEITPEALLPKVFSQSGAAGIVGGLTGAALGGLLLAETGGLAALLGSVLCYGVAAGLLSMIPSKDTWKTTSKTTGTVLQELAGGFHYMRQHELLLRLFSIMFTGQLVFHSSIAFLSVYTIEHLERSATTYGLLDATLSLGGVIAGILGAWWWKKTKQYVALASLMVMAIGLFQVAFSSFILVSFAGVMLIGLGTTWVRIMLQSIQQMATEKEYHGRMASYRMMFNQTSVVISGPILGWAASEFGVTSVYLLLLLPTLFGMIAAWNLRKRQAYGHVVKSA
ncbi:MFS transporter [Thalassobacillus hwangdonensis]|uniref:MFS transporter n=1 Tax=Thalassobacillus hwangdonensis TaxID=546108 RepID=A0ABW3L1J4_9BACI